MNVYFITAGIIGVIGGLAHTFLGHKWTVNTIDEHSLKSTRNTGDQDKRFLTWFWHIGSVVLVSTSLIILLYGLDQIEASTDLLQFISFMWISITTLFFIIALKAPSQLFKMIPGLVGLPINILILLGLYL